MHVWFRWIFYLNPGAYAFEALMANEFVGKSFQCVQPDYIPYGSGYPGSESPYRGCSIPGSEGDVILGAAYIRAQYNYSWHHIWRSFGVIIGFWVFFIVLTALGLELLNSQGGSSVLLYSGGARRQDRKTPRPQCKRPRGRRMPSSRPSPGMTSTTTSPTKDRRNSSWIRCLGS